MTTSFHGTPGADVIGGRDGSDSIEARGGADIVFGGSGADLVEAGQGATTSGASAAGTSCWVSRGRPCVRRARSGERPWGPGTDHIVGNAESDLCLSAMDEHPGNRVLGGPGFDTADRDDGDRLFAVERITDNVCFGG